MNGSSDLAPGVVELREDVPLKVGFGGAAGDATCCARGPRLIITCFATLTAAITLALFTQIYYGDYEIVPHGGVASDAEACSGAGTDVLKAGGRAMDAAVAAATCLAVLAPHLTSLDASGSLLFWEYRQARTQQPTLVEWQKEVGVEGGWEVPRLLAALVTLHAQHGALPWARVLQPAIDLAKNGFVVSEGLAAALVRKAKVAEESNGTLVASLASPSAGSLSSAPELAAYLESLQRNTSAELSAAWNAAVPLSTVTAAASAAGGWRLYAGGSSALQVKRALAQALDPPPSDLDEASRRVISALQLEAKTAVGDGWPPTPSGVATGLAVVDSSDTYVALVIGLSVAFGSGQSPSSSKAKTKAGSEWTHDVPTAPLDLAPAILLNERVCGTRYVLGGGSGAALAQAAAALASGGGAGGADVERPRANVLAGGMLAVEAGLLASALPAGAVLAEERVLTPTVNVVQQRADALLTHADSRGGGIASRF